RTAATRTAIGDWDAMTPPQLARDAPVANVLHPVEVDAREPLRDDPNATIAHKLERWIGERLDAQVPLIEQQWLQNGARALTVANTVGVGLLFDELARRLEFGDQSLPRFFGGQASVGARLGVHRAVEVHHVD